MGFFPIVRDRDGYLIHIHEVKMYSLKSDSGRCIDDFQGRRLLDGSPKLVNGKLHWFGGGAKIIFAFDLADEKWTKVEHPSYVKRHTFLRVIFPCFTITHRLLLISGF